MGVLGPRHSSFRKVHSIVQYRPTPSVGEDPELAPLARHQVTVERARPGVARRRLAWSGEIDETMDPEPDRGPAQGPLGFVGALRIIEPALEAAPCPDCGYLGPQRRRRPPRPSLSPRPAVVWSDDEETREGLRDLYGEVFIPRTF